MRRSRCRTCKTVLDDGYEYSCCPDPHCPGPVENLDLADLEASTNRMRQRLDRVVDVAADVVIGAIESFWYWLG
ncbi:MAG TPA: hypothetical protein VGF94_16025 [Kofleriaceae bacterium]